MEAGNTNKQDSQYRLRLPITKEGGNLMQRKITSMVLKLNGFPDYSKTITIKSKLYGGYGREGLGC